MGGLADHLAIEMVALNDFDMVDVNCTLTLVTGSDQ